MEFCLTWWIVETLICDHERLIESIMQASLWSVLEQLCEEIYRVLSKMNHGVNLRILDQDEVM